MKIVVRFGVLAVVALLSQSALADSFVTTGMRVTKAQVGSYHNTCPDGCTEDSSDGSLTQVQFNEYTGHLEGRADVTGLQIAQPQNTLYPDLSAIEFSIDATEWQTALANGTADGLEPVHANGNVTLILAPGKQVSSPIECALYDGRSAQISFHANREFECWISPVQVEPDSPYFVFEFSK